MEHVNKKKAFMGKGYTYEPAGSSGSYVVLDKDEYEKLEHDRKLYEYWWESEKERHQQDIEKAKKDMEKYRRDCDEHSDAVITSQVSAVKKAAREKIAATETELKKQSGLNESLLRIMKERANATRGMQPKKVKSGYRFIGKIMQTKTISGHDKQTGAIYTDAWMTTLETPYDSGIPFDQIEGRIFADLMKENGILEKMHVDFWTFKGESNRLWKGTYIEAVKDIKKSECYLFDYKFMANPKSGFWEIQITTTGSIFMNPDLT